MTRVIPMQREQNDALALWCEAERKMLLPLFPNPKGERRIHIPVKVVNEVLNIVTNFQITKQRTLIDKIIDQLNFHRHTSEELKARYGSTPWYKFKLRRTIMRAHQDEDKISKAMQEVLLIVVNTPPQ